MTGEEPHAIGTVLPHSYSADDTCHLWKAGIPCLLYGPGVIRGSADEDDACVLVSEMVKVTRVLAVTALDVCQRPPAELAIASAREPRAGIDRRRRDGLARPRTGTRVDPRDG